MFGLIQNKFVFAGAGDTIFVLVLVGSRGSSLKVIFGVLQKVLPRCWDNKVCGCFWGVFFNLFHIFPSHLMFF